MMDQATITELTGWLESNKGRNLIINKEEHNLGNHDLDRIELVLDDVVMRHADRPDPDDFVAKHEVVLQGQGTIHTKEGQMELPQRMFEIPIEGKLATRKIDDGLIVETERALYAIHLH
jgi:hypothetical protein